MKSNSAKSMCHSFVKDKSSEWVTVNWFTMDKILHSFSPSYLLKLTARQTKIFVFVKFIW